MKRIISILIATMLSLGFSIYNSYSLDSAFYRIYSADHVSTSNQARKILEKIYTSAESKNFEINEDEFFVPVLLLSAKQDYDVDITLPSDLVVEMSVDYKIPLDFNFKNYQIEFLKFGRVSNKEQKNVGERQLSEGFEICLHNNVKFYYASEYKEYNSSLLVNLAYFPDDTSMCFVAVYVQDETELTNDLLEILCEDFTYVSLRDLKDLIR